MEPLTRNAWQRYQFTPGAERAFEFAEAWESSEGSNEIHPVELLCGLLAEPDCRASLLLAARGVDERAVLARWPDLAQAAVVRGERHKQFSSEVQALLRTACEALRDYEQPVSMATEHLLLGLAKLPGEVSRWLAERGVAAEELEAEVHRLAGYEPNPTPISQDELDGAEAANASCDASVEPPKSDAPQPAEAHSAPEPAEHPSPATTTEAASASAQPASPPTPAASPAALTAREQALVWRVIDAAANRAGEGLRVVEDYARFILDDRRLSAEAKQMRHDLTAALTEASAPARLTARNVSGDVGATLTTDAERHRASPQDVALASCKRAQQALRSLEEYSKMVAPGVSPAFERLRYRSYELEQSVALARSKLALLATARLYVLVDSQGSPEAFAALVDALVAAEVDVIQLRDKSRDDRTLLDRARRLAAATRGTRTLFIMNDRADLATLAGADGVHVGQEELTVAEARAIVGPDALVGVSTHSLAQAQAAERDGADYIGVGPTFPSETKSFAEYKGLELVCDVARGVTLPAFAIGGIDAANVGQVIAAGLGRVAVSGAVSRAADPRAAARELKGALAS